MQCIHEIIFDDDNSMEMIWHDYKFIQFDRKVTRKIPPRDVNDFSIFSQF